MNDEEFSEDVAAPSTVEAPRRRGRPKGSKNKPKDGAPAQKLKKSEEPHGPLTVVPEGRRGRPPLRSIRESDLGRMVTLVYTKLDSGELRCFPVVGFDVVEEVVLVDVYDAERHDCRTYELWSGCPDGSYPRGEADFPACWFLVD